MADVTVACVIAEGTEGLGSMFRFEEGFMIRCFLSALLNPYLVFGSFQILCLMLNRNNAVTTIALGEEFSINMIYPNYADIHLMCEFPAEEMCVCVCVFHHSCLKAIAKYNGSLSLGKKRRKKKVREGENRIFCE